MKLAECTESSALMQNKAPGFDNIHVSADLMTNRHATCGRCFGKFVNKSDIKWIGLGYGSYL